MVEISQNGFVQKSLSGTPIFQVNVSGSGSGGFSSGGQVSACANEENSELAFKIENPSFSTTGSSRTV